MAFGVVYLLAWIAAALVVLFVGSALLRASVALANRTIGPVNRDEPIGWDWDAEEDDEDVLPAGDGAAIPEPGIGPGMRVLFLAGVAQIAAVFVLHFVLDEIVDIRRGIESPPGFVLCLASGFLLLTLVSAWLLPATFARAALVALYFHLILVVIAALFAGLVFAVLG